MVKRVKSTHKEGDFRGKGVTSLTDVEPDSRRASSTDDTSPERTKRRRRRTPSSRNARKNEELLTCSQDNEILEMLKLLNVKFDKQSKQNKDHISEIRKQLDKVLENQNVQSKELEKLRKQSELHTNGTSHTSDAPRSQSNQLQPPRYRLEFTSGKIHNIEKGQTIDISVALVDCNNNQTVENGPLASATVELVVVEAEFNEHDSQYNWSREDFERYMRKPRRGNKATGDVDQSVKSIVSNGQFNLVHGAKCYSGSTIFENSSNKRVKLGVMVVSRTEERVLEGVSNPFFVRGHDRPGRQNNLRHNSSNVQKQALVDNDYQEQNSPMPNLPQPSQINSTQTAENGLDITWRQSQSPSPRTNMLSTVLSTGHLPSAHHNLKVQMEAEVIMRESEQALVDNAYQEKNSPMLNLPHTSRINSTQTTGNGLDIIGRQSQLPFSGTNMLSTEPSTGALIPPYADPDLVRVAQTICRQNGQALVDNDYQEQRRPMPNLPHPSRINLTQTEGNRLDIIGGQSQLPFPGTNILSTEPSTSALIPPYPDPDLVRVAQAICRQNDHNQINCSHLDTDWYSHLGTLTQLKKGQTIDISVALVEGNNDQTV